jgi:uncharacterized coiled-coil DUF342 family protein
MLHDIDLTIDFVRKSTDAELVEKVHKIIRKNKRLIIDNENLQSKLEKSNDKIRELDTGLKTVCKRNSRLLKQVSEIKNKLEKSIALNEELVKRIDELMFYQTHLDECNCLGCKQDIKEIQQYQARINKLKGESTP